MDEAVSYINTKALNGSDWAYKFKEKNPNQIRPIKLTKARVRNILNLGAWESGDVEGLVRILVTGNPAGDNEAEVQLILEHVESYIRCIDMMAKDKLHTTEDFYRFQDEADKCGDALLKVWGDTGVTNYFHILISGHLRDLMIEWGPLLPWSNEGVEALNGIFKLWYHKHTQCGGSAGINGAACSKALGMGNWMVRRWLWLCGLGDKLFTEEGKAMIEAMFREVEERERAGDDPMDDGGSDVDEDSGDGEGDGGGETEEGDDDDDTDRLGYYEEDEDYYYDDEEEDDIYALI